MLTWRKQGSGVVTGKLRCPAAAGMVLVLGAWCVLNCHVPPYLCCLWRGKALRCLNWHNGLRSPCGRGLLQPFCASPSRSLNRLRTCPLVRMLRHVAASCVGRQVVSCGSSSLNRGLSAGAIRCLFRRLLPRAPAGFRSPAANAD